MAHAHAHDSHCGCGTCAPTASSVASAPSLGATQRGELVTDTAALSQAAGSMLALQRTVGNAAVNGLLSRRMAAGAAVLARRGFFGGAETPREEYEDAIEEKRDYISSGPYGPTDFRSSTGLGGFNVGYDAALQELRVILRGSVNFIDGITLSGGVATAVQPTPAAQTAAANINLMAPADRAAAVAGWQWDSASKAVFLGQFQAVVAAVWSGQHAFHSTKTYWDDLGAIPNVSSEVHEGEKTGDDHMAMSVYRVPPNFVGTVGVVNSGSGFFGYGAANDNRMTLNSNDVDARADSVLEKDLDFVAGGTALDPANAAELTQFAIRFQSGGPVCGMCGNKIEAAGGVAITATIESEGAGEEAETNARARFDALVAGLVASGMPDAAARVQYARGGTGTKAHMRVGDGIAQYVAAHEAGHMFGLGDRYATTAGSGIGGTGPSAGLPSTHDGLAAGSGLEGAKAANDDGIMSWGNRVRPADYATFLEALKSISGMAEWAYGPPGVVNAPPDPNREMGDFPAPAPGGPAAA